MSETPETQESCESAGGTWTDGKCVMPAPAEKATKDMNLTERLESVIKDVLDLKLAALEKAMDKKIEDILQSKEVEMEQALRKGFGLDNDPVIHQSDLVAAIRKAALDNAESAKRTPAPKEKAGPDGNTPKDSFDAAIEKKFKEMN